MHFFRPDALYNGDVFFKSKNEKVEISGVIMFKFKTNKKVVTLMVKTNEIETGFKTFESSFLGLKS
jgi:hypothetical protein